MISPEMPLLLGSGSPRRREILSGLGIPLRVLPADVNEELAAGEAPLPYLERIVNDKMRAVSARVGALSCAGVLVADTIVVIDDEVLGKPADVREAEALLARLVGRSHVVYTRYGLESRLTSSARSHVRTVATRVTMRSASPDEIARYARTEEGLDKAGAYAAQGIGAFLLQGIEGSYSNVVGLPACEVILDLVELGLLERFPV